MIKFSIVIPVYNTPETYLLECLNSVTNQDYDKNRYEIILVNDGSTDNNVYETCKKFTSQSNFNYVYKENGGVSSARNMGITMAKGNYIVFIDPDDYIASDYLSFADSLSIKNKLISFLSQTVYKNKKVGNTWYNDGTVWAKVFDLKLIKENNIQFNTKLKFCEDNLFIEDCGKVMEMKKINYLGYFYRKNNYSISNAYRLLNYKFFNDTLREIKDTYNSELEFYSFVFYNFLNIILPTSIYHKNCKLKSKEKKKLLNEILSDEYYYKESINFLSKRGTFKKKICAKMAKHKLFRILIIFVKINNFIK